MAHIQRPAKQALIRYFKGESIADEAALIELYLAMDQDQPFVQQCLREAWNGMEEEPDVPLAAPELDVAWQQFQSRRTQQTNRPAKWTYRKQPLAAAIALLCISIALLSYIRHHSQKQEDAVYKVTTYQLVQAGLGRLKTITLPDSSTVTLFPGTRMEIPSDYNRTDRTIRMAGKAYFDVRPDPDKPFSVHSGALTTRVLGTSFEVVAPQGSDRQNVTLRSGKVGVYFGGNELGLLAPDQRMEVGSSGDFTITRVNAPQTTAWIKEQLNYDQATLQEICTELESWYDVRLSISNAALKSKRVTASFKNQPLKKVLDILATTAGCHYTWTNKQVTIY